MTTDWFVTRDGTKTAGPLSAQQLEQLYATGRLKPTDLVRQGSEQPWLPAFQMKDRFRAGSPTLVEEPPTAPAAVSPALAAPPAPVEPVRAPAVMVAPSVARSSRSPWLIGLIGVGSLLLMLGVVGGVVAFWVMSSREETSTT